MQSSTNAPTIRAKIFRVRGSNMGQQPAKRRAVEGHDAPEHHLERALPRLVTQQPLRRQRARPAADHAEEVEGSLLRAPFALPRRRLVERVGDEGDQAGREIHREHADGKLSEIRRRAYEGEKGGCHDKGGCGGHAALQRMVLVALKVDENFQPSYGLLLLGACGACSSRDCRYFTQPRINCGQSGTAGSGAVFSGSRPQSAGWCQHSSCSVLSRWARIPWRSLRTSSTSCSRDIRSRSASRSFMDQMGSEQFSGNEADAAFPDNCSDPFIG